MLWLKYLAFLPIHIAAILLRYPLAPVAVYWSVVVHGSYKLVTPFKWLDTIDNDLGGDDGWKQEHITGDPYSFWNMTRWIFRNGGNAVNYGLLGCDVNDPHPFIRTRTNAMFGWNMVGPQHGRCKFCFTPRLGGLL